MNVHASARHTAMHQARFAGKGNRWIPTLLLTTGMVTAPALLPTGADIAQFRSGTPQTETAENPSAETSNTASTILSDALDAVNPPAEAQCRVACSPGGGSNRPAWVDALLEWLRSRRR